MRKNLLRDPNVSSMFIAYTSENKKYKKPARVFFFDTEECYFATEISLDFNKPKKKTPAEIIVYTEEGVYRSKVKIMDTSVSGFDLLYITELPKQWSYAQLRTSTRKAVSIPFIIKFNDGFEINTTTYDLALGGISFYSNKPIPDNYTKFHAELTMKLPDIPSIKFESKVMDCVSKFLRIHKTSGETGEDRYVFKFINLSESDKLFLKNFLIYID